MRKKLILFLAAVAVAALVLFGVSCTREEQRERERYDTQQVQYDILDPDFDASGSVSRVILAEGHTRGTRVSATDEGDDGALDNLVDLNDATVYYSQDDTDKDHEIEITLDLNKYYYIDRVDLVPAYAEDGVAQFFPTEFYVEISCDNIEWTIVAARTDYSVPDHTVSLRMGAQSARYVRFTATSLRSERGEYRLALGGIGVWFDDYRSNGKIVAEPGTAYYVSDSEGDDSNDGRTPQTAFKTFNRVNGMVFSGGNSILLKRGDTWRGQSLQPSGDGAKDAPVIISSYGEGENPVIAAGNGLATGLLLSNVSWYTVRGIDFCDSPFGIKIESKLKNIDLNTYEFEPVEGFVIADCNFTDHRANSISEELFIMRYPDAYFGAGINLIAYGTEDTWGERANHNACPYIQEGDKPNTYLRNVQIENCEFQGCDTGILNYFVDLLSFENGAGAAAPYYNNNCLASEELTWSFHNRAVSDVIIRNVTINESYKSGGIIIYGMSNVLCDNVKIYKTGIEGMHWGVAAMQVSMCENVLVQNSEFAEVYRRNNSPDGEGFDIEAGNINVTLKDSVIRDTAGPAVLVFGLNSGWGGYNRNSVFDNVLFENCGAYDTAIYQNVFHITAESIATMTGSGSSIYHGNLGGIVKNCKIVLKWEGQGFETGYTVSGKDDRGVYDELTDTTTLGLAFDSSNVVYNPGERVQVYGNGTNLKTEGLVSSGADYAVGYLDGDGNFVADPSFATEGSIYTGSNAEEAVFHADSLGDGELSGGYEFNSGFSSARFESETVNFSILIDLGQVETFSAVRLFGVQRYLPGASDYGTMLPADLTVHVSEDGMNWEQMNIHALDENGAAIRGGVSEVTGLTLASRPCQDLRFLLDTSGRYVRIDITKARKNPMGGGYYVQLAEVQVISGLAFDLKTEYVAEQVDHET